MKKILTFLITLTTLFTLISCKDKANADIVVTMYPWYDITNQITKDKLSVKLLVPLGSEVHDFGPTSKDLVEIKNSKLFLYSSERLDSWLDDSLLNDVNNLNLSLNFDNSLSIIEDSHFWTDPIIFINLIDVIKDEIIKIDPSNKEYYETNALNYKTKIESIHIDAKTYFDSKDNTKIFFAGHNAMKAFGARYQIDIHSVTDHGSHDADLTPQQIEKIVNEIMSANSKYIFTEELAHPHIAETIQRELKNKNYSIEILELHGYHNISEKEFKEGLTYAELFQRNIDFIKQAATYRSS